jgi:2-keto-4-pentenoate hydratase/2-oxohepta-3-ene-1,7-dioic acid hydratase in catechol pathway
VIDSGFATMGELLHAGAPSQPAGEPVQALVVYLSKLMTLEPGDIVSTGRPAGVGSLRKPRGWLKPGDEVVIESATLGRLATTLD